jgi:hypothetical protein
VKRFLFVLILFSFHLKGQVCFTPFVSYTAGTSSSAIVTGDYNGDSILDLALANVISNNVSILLGNGTGGFGIPTNFSVATGPISICTADFNGDNKLDLVTANNSSNNISIILGNGMGSFGSATNFTVGSQPTSIIEKDFDNNGTVDIAVSNNNGVSILMGNGLGGFSSPSNFIANVSSPPDNVLSADFNGDSFLDLVTANGAANNISILLGNGTGGFSAATSFTVASGTSTPSEICVADFNGDGKTDVATSNYSLFNVSVLLGTGTGNFSAPTTYPVGNPNPRGLTSADFDGDGNADIAVANEPPGKAYVLLGNGSGIFGTAIGYSAGLNSTPRKVVAKDFNGDSKIDICLLSGQNPSGAIVLLNCGVMGFEEISSEKAMSISPNPTTGWFTIETNTAGVQAVNLYDVNGRNVLRSNLNNTTDVDASNLDNGIYIAAIKSKTTITYRKIIIAK